MATLDTRSLATRVIARFERLPSRHVTPACPQPAAPIDGLLEVARLPGRAAAMACGARHLSVDSSNDGRLSVDEMTAALDRASLDPLTSGAVQTAEQTLARVEAAEIALARAEHNERVSRIILGVSAGLLAGGAVAAAFLAGPVLAIILALIALAALLMQINALNPWAHAANTAQAELADAVTAHGRAWDVIETAQQPEPPPPPVRDAAISDVIAAGGWAANAWQRDLLTRADTNRDGRVSTRELDDYLANPADYGFIARSTFDRVRAAPQLETGAWDSRLAYAADHAGNADGAVTDAEIIAYLRTGRGPRELTEQSAAVVRNAIARLSSERSTLAMSCAGNDLTRDTMQICYDDARRIPSSVAYVFDARDFVEDVPRRDSFRFDPALSQGVRAELSDYLRSGFDRGHLRPADDSPTPDSMSESFLLSNMSPQHGRVNQQAWRLLEQAVHNVVLATGSRATIVSGNLFLDANEQPLRADQIQWISNGRVAVPTHLYKAMLIELPDGRHTMMAWVVENSPTAPSRRVDIEPFLRASRRSVDFIEARLGEDLFRGVENEEAMEQEAPHRIDGVSFPDAALLWETP